MSIQEAAQDKAALRPWLYEALPEMDETDGTPYATKDGVRESIEQATGRISTEAFTPDELVERLDRTKRYLQESGETYEFLIGLDEVAIYVGDQQHRYREFLETVDTLIADINPQFWEQDSGRCGTCSRISWERSILRRGTRTKFRSGVPIQRS